MTIDLRPYENKVSYAKNGVPLGVAYSGLDNWKTDIYIMFSLYYLHDRVRIIDYYVAE